MRFELLRGMVTFLLAGIVAVAVATAPPPDVDRAERIGSRIRCPVCQAESIADSNAGLARDMMELVRRRVAEGYSDDQIIDELLASYGGSQLIDPPWRPETAPLWLVPLAATGLGGWLVTTRRRREGRP